MNDPALARLIHALDDLVSKSSDDARTDLDESAQRIKLLSRRLGVLAEDSPYLAFIRRVLDDRRQTSSIAASA